MGKGKRGSATVLSSSDDDGEAKSFSPKKGNRRRYSKSAPSRKNPKRAKKASLSNSYGLRDVSNGFDEVKRFCEEFEQGLTQFKVTSGSGSNSLWVEKYKPSCLEELAVHKKKVEEVKTWFEERLKNSVDSSCSNVLLISGQAGVGKSATIHAIACHFGAEVHEWNTPTPTLWTEHQHNSNSGMRYISKLDEFESFVERIRKYGLVSPTLSRASTTLVILLIDDLPLVNGKVSYGRLHRSLHLLLQSVRLPTAILLNEFGRSESSDQHARYWEELQSSLQHAGACKVVFNPITVNSIKKTLTKICRMEQAEVNDEQIDAIAKASEGDIRNAITSLQYFSVKAIPVHSLMASESLSDHPEEKGYETGHLDNMISLQVGKDATLSLFHALGKFLHNKRETGISMSSAESNTVHLKEKYLRCPLRMDAPEVVLSQAHGQARPIADFLHENFLDFVDQEAMDDAWVVAAYLSDTDLLLAPVGGTLAQDFNAENLMQSAAASVAVRGVLFGNTHPVSARWHTIRRPRLWEVERSMWQTKHQILCQRRDVHSGVDLTNFSIMATEFKPAHSWLGHRVHEDPEGCGLVYSEDERDGIISLNEMDDIDEDDEIEDW